MTYRILQPLLLIFLLTTATMANAYTQTNDAKNVADELNALYNKTDNCANDQPDYYCSGIILRTQFIDLQLQKRWWQLSNQDFGSFTYLRHDITPHIGRPVYPSSTHGYILTSQKDLSTLKQYGYKIYCSYPLDGASNYRSMHGCGDFVNVNVNTFNNHESDYSSCKKQGVFTLQQYISKYGSGSGCSFASDYTGFKLSMDVTTYLYNDHKELGCRNENNGITYCSSWNEIVVSSWTSENNHADQVPIKAIFVLINGGASYESVIDADVLSAIRLAYEAADQYYEFTNKTREIPVVTLDLEKLKNGNTDIFAPALRPTPGVRAYSVTAQVHSHGKF